MAVLRGCSIACEKGVGKALCGLLSCTEWLQGCRLNMASQFVQYCAESQPSSLSVLNDVCVRSLICVLLGLRTTVHALAWIRKQADWRCLFLRRMDTLAFSHCQANAGAARDRQCPCGAAQKHSVLACFQLEHDLPAPAGFHASALQKSTSEPHP